VERGIERDRLLGLVVDHILENGLAGLTLRGIAAATGSNNRMLLYYFGSKEQLIVDALRAARLRFPRFAEIPDILRDSDDGLETRLLRAWDGISALETRPFVRLFFSVFGLAVSQPGVFGGWLDTVADDFAADVAATLVRDGIDPGPARVLARELVAAWRGLQMDLLSAGDDRRVHLAAQANAEAICTRALATKATSRS
jgi:AcrR family transcriptional regulator